MNDFGWESSFPEEVPLDVFLRYKLGIDEAIQYARAVSVRSAGSQWIEVAEPGIGGMVLTRISELWEISGQTTAGYIPAPALERLSELDTRALLALSLLHWPRLERWDELNATLVRLRDFSSRNVRDWVETFDGDLRRAESMANHVHLWDWFNGDDSSAADFVSVAEVVASGWRAKLARDCPAGRYVVSLTQESYGPEVTFYSA